MSSTNTPISRSVIKSGNVHLVDFFKDDLIIGQVQLPADENNTDVMCLVTASGYLEMFGLRELEGLTAKQHYQQMKQYATENAYLEVGALTVTADKEELFVLVNNVPILSLSRYDLTERYPGCPVAHSKPVDDQMIHIRGIHPTLKHQIPKVDITQMAGDIINRFYQQIPMPYQKMANH